MREKQEPGEILRLVQDLRQESAVCCQMMFPEGSIERGTSQVPGLDASSIYRARRSGRTLDNTAVPYRAVLWGMAQRLGGYGPEHFQLLIDFLVAWKAILWGGSPVLDVKEALVRESATDHDEDPWQDRFLAYGRTEDLAEWLPRAKLQRASLNLAIEAAERTLRQADSAAILAGVN